MKHIKLFEQFVNEAADSKKVFKELKKVYEISKLKEVRPGYFEFDFDGISDGIGWDMTTGEVHIEDYNSKADSVRNLVSTLFDYIKNEEDED